MSIAGTYNDETGQALCKKCTGGFYPYSTETGQKSKSATCKGVGCSVGKYSSEVGTESLQKCKSCLPGTYNDEIGQALCKGCTGGQYSTEVNQSSCKGGCSVGKYSFEVGNISPPKCKSCQGGTHNDEIGRSSCEECLTGTYNDETGKASCKNCPSGWDNADPGDFACIDDTDPPNVQSIIIYM